MVKQVPKSDAVKALIAKATGDEGLNPDDLAVYEAIFANTLPLRRQNGIYQGAQMGADVLAAACERLKAGETIPLQSMHQPGLPKGRVIAAKMVPGSDGSTEIRGMFYIPRQNNDGLMTKLDTGVINEVSVNFMPSQLLCSACGFDYMGEEATFDNLWDCTCANDHKIGKDGTHVRIHGLKSWNELSLVDRGAVAGAKILPRSQQMDPARFSESEAFTRMTLLCASVSDTLEPENTDMDVSALLAASATDKASLIVAQRDVTDLTAKLAASETQITDLLAKLAEAEGKLLAASTQDNAKLKADADMATALITEITTAALAASGRGTEALPETTSARVELFRELRAKLAVAIPVGGRATGAAHLDDPENKPSNYDAYRSAK